MAFELEFICHNGTNRGVGDQSIRNRVVEKLLHKRVTGAHKRQVDTVKNWLPSHEQGRGERLIREMIRDPEAPLEAYGGSRDNVRLTSVDEAVAYLRENGGDVPFGF